MSRYYDRYYDHWERLVGAVMRREQLRQLSLEDSVSASTRSFDSDYSSFSSRHLSFTPSPSPLHRQGKKSGTTKRRTIWKGFSIFSGFTSKKEYGKVERDLRWVRSQKTIHESMKFKNHGYEEIPQNRTEIERLQELYTLKGHIESIFKTKGINIHTMNNHYTI